MRAENSVAIMVVKYLETCIKSDLRCNSKWNEYNKKQIEQHMHNHFLTKQEQDPAECINLKGA